MAFDPASSRVVLTGVYRQPVSAPAVTETWGWNGQDWSLVDQFDTTPPAPLSMAFEPISGRLILTGVATGSPSPAWSWTGSKWVVSAPAPSGTWTIVTDGARQQVLAVTAFLGTFVWDGRSWTRAHADDDRNVTANAAFAWYPNANQIVETGVTHDGRSFTDEAFGWTGLAWTLLSA
jgi:hypothetical protein